VVLGDANRPCKTTLDAPPEGGSYDVGTAVTVQSDHEMWVRRVDGNLPLTFNGKFDNNHNNPGTPREAYYSWAGDATSWGNGHAQRYWLYDLMCQFICLCPRGGYTANSYNRFRTPAQPWVTWTTYANASHNWNVQQERQDIRFSTANEPERPEPVKSDFASCFSTGSGQIAPAPKAEN